MAYEMCELGGYIINAAEGEVTGVYRTLQAVTDLVLTSISINGVTNAADLAGIIIPAGEVLPFAKGITAIEVTSGTGYLGL